MKKIIKHLKNDIEFISLILTNKEIPSPVVISLWGQRKKCEEELKKYVK